MTTSFQYQAILETHEHETTYRLLTRDFISQFQGGGETFLKINPEALTLLTAAAMRDISHLLRSKHLAQLKKIYDDPEASANDRFVALELLKNANIAAGFVLPSCQDTGTAIVLGKKGQNVFTGGNDEIALAQGVFKTFQSSHLRYSQLAPLSLFQEVNTGSNLPAQIEITACPGGEYHFLFIAKGGGSANKTFLFQETKALLNPKSLKEFLAQKIKLLGTSACPPYHLAVVVGGLSAEHCLKVAKLASTGELDHLPGQGNALGRGFRDQEFEQEVFQLTQSSGIGAQFGGKYFCHDVRVIRLPRHAASCPVALAVSCSADRQARGKITPEGVFLEQLETHPAQYLPEVELPQQEAIHIDLNRPMSVIRQELSQYPIATRLMLTGSLIVARDQAHARIKEQLDQGKPLPDYFKEFLVYYAGPAKTPEGLPSGSFGPTTAGRMDSYVELFQANGGSFVMLAKGNRSAQVKEACKKYGGFYLGSIGGPAARLAQDCISKVEVLDFPELGMEAVFKITIHDFPAFVIIDDKGNDFFKNLT